MILAIDPGPKESSCVYFDEKTKIIEHFFFTRNNEIANFLSGQEIDNKILVIEMIASYGMPVGEDVFDTCVWIGRFIQAWPFEYKLIYRKEVCLHLCGSARAKDPNIRQALIDKFPATGGGKVPQIGIKRNPGPLFGITSHLWAALAVAVTYAETKQ